MYLDFMSDKYLLGCVDRLYRQFQGAYCEVTVDGFTSNKIDVISMRVVSQFAGRDEKTLIEAETVRQAEKTFGNAVGTFHEELMGGLPGIKNYPVGHGYDLKADDNSIFAEVKNKYNTMNSGASKSVFERLVGFAGSYPAATCYLVQIIAQRSRDDIWVVGGKQHARVRVISADRFYASVTGQRDAFAQLYRVLPTVIHDYLEAHGDGCVHEALGPYGALETMAQRRSKSVLDILALKTFSGYWGF